MAITSALCRKRSRVASLQPGFNPRPRAGGDVLHQRLDSVGGIVSIHAPARGATRGRGLPPITFQVSIHAPARGATRTPDRTQLAADVSIHAPARGATRTPDRTQLAADVSIHAPARG